MKQILQNLGNGETLLVEVPCPRRAPGNVLCQTTRTLVSLGTEKMLIDFGKAGWIGKARSQPDKVRQVVQKIRTDGLNATVQSVRSKLDSPIPLGYCHVGQVVESDERSGFATGQRIISNGPHAEMVSVPENLMARIPDDVSDDQAAFAVVGAIGLQGIRLLKPTLGERIVVSGLGLIGLVTVQILKAHGCHVLGIDLDARKLELARQYGASTVDLAGGQDPVAMAAEWTQGLGVDGVLITASTKSDEVVHQAATMCRKRGRIVLTGVVGLNLQRSDFYEKELSFQVSCSYGPGRYDDNYEKRGLDYPIGYVRWTEKRNFQAVLELMSDGKLDTSDLVTHRFPFERALDGYQVVNDPSAMGILLEYSTDSGLVATKKRQTVVVKSETSVQADGDVGIAFIGAGEFTTRVLLPLLPQQGISRQAIVSSTGVSATHAARKFGFQQVSSDVDGVLKNDSIDAVFITTRHNTHAGLVCQALLAGKHVFVEKPLALTEPDLGRIESELAEHPDCCLTVGFNRRFSPHMVNLRQWLQSCAGPRSIVITVNAGQIPAEHWAQDPETGGGRIIGEACHFIDVSRFLAESPIDSVSVRPMGGTAGKLGDCASIQLGFANESIATIHYFSNGSKDFPKERIEVFAGGHVATCNNFRFSNQYGTKRSFRTRGQDKGHRAELAAFVNTIRNGGPWPIPAEQLLDVSRTSIQASRQVFEMLGNSG